MDSRVITVAYGDGIGPEIMEVTLALLQELKVPLTIETIDIGKASYDRGVMTGIPDSAWESIERTRILLKAPITTPQGGGYKSLNVTLRRSLGLFANVRPTLSYHPFVATQHPKMNVVVVRENEEDLYTGIEHRQTQEVYQCLKLISRSGSERIMRYAFEYAKKNNRKKVTCFSKDNIMKMTDGIFHKMFDEVAKEYPDIEADHYIVDIGSARLANCPEQFDVIVTENLYGDIISDIAAEISGSVGLAGSANIGAEYAMFEAIHGSAPDIAGKGIANPSGLINGAVMMLVHLGFNEHATTLHNALLSTIESGIHTADIYDVASSKEKVSTEDFGKAVIEHFGTTPTRLMAVEYAPSDSNTNQQFFCSVSTKEPKELVGVDVFFDWQEGEATDLANRVEALCEATELKLQKVSSRGLKMWPGKANAAICSDHWQCRFVPEGLEKHANHQQVVALLAALADAELDFIKTELLYKFGETLGFSLSQGE